jgi:hypothetical protein
MKIRLSGPTCSALALFLAMAGTVLAEPAGITLLGSGFTGTPFAITGDIVAESDSLYETIRDFSQPDAPTVISSTMGHAMDTILREFVCGDGLLVGLTGPAPYGEIGLSLFDVNDLAKPDYLGTINTLPYESAWMRGRELLASTNGLLVAYDLSAPLSPLFTAFIPLATHDGSRWPSAVGNTLYQIETGATLRALDVSSAGQPATLGLPALAGDRIDALAAGTGVIYALVAVSVGQVDEHLDLVTSNVGVPAVPVEVDRVTISVGAGAAGRSLIRSGDLLVAATADGQVQAFGLETPSEPEAGWVLAHDCSRLVVTPSAILVREGRDLFTYARTAWNVAPVLLNHRGPLPQLHTVVGEGPLQIAQYYWDRSILATVDVSEPALPRLGPPIQMDSSGGQLQYVDGIGLMAASSVGRLVDFADPAQPVERDWISGEDGRSLLRLMSRELVVVENRMTDFGLKLLDISDLSDPVQASVINERILMGAADGLLAGGNAAGVRLYDIADLTAPQLVGALPDPGEVTCGTFWRGHFYAVTTRNGTDKTLEAWDLGNLSAPILVSSLPLSFTAKRLDLHGSRLYVQGYMIFQVFDLANLGTPVALADAIWHNSAGNGFAMNGNVTTIGGQLLTMRNDGLSPSAVPPVALAAVQFEPAWPNPFNPSTQFAFVVDTERDLTLSVYDVRGRRLTELAHGRFTSGRHNATWDGTDNTGTGVAAGVYLVRLHGTGIEAVQTVTLVK